MTRVGIAVHTRCCRGPIGRTAHTPTRVRRAGLKPSATLKTFSRTSLNDLGCQPGSRWPPNSANGVRELGASAQDRVVRVIALSST